MKTKNGFFNSIAQFAANHPSINGLYARIYIWINFFT